MDLAIIEKRSPPINELPVEVVERKGLGHPDSLADGIAEQISVDYSKHCLRHPQIGHVLHHNVDKIEILGGHTKVGFGHFDMVKPITVVLSGRMSRCFGDHEVPAEEIAREAAASYLHRILPQLDPASGLIVDSKIGSAGSPGRNSDWYRPQRTQDLMELHDLRANDSVCCVGYAPLSTVEQAVLELESYLNSAEFKTAHPMFGSDIKVLAYRRDRRVHFTLCVPLMAKATPSLDAYVTEKKSLCESIRTDLVEQLKAKGTYSIEVSINTKDDYEMPSLYLTGIGSAIENGDEGQVGRGNRSNGLISNVREMSIEAPCGKNPVYHAGKIYNVVARQIADEVWRFTGRENYVNIITQNGRPMEDPLAVVVKLVGGGPHKTHRRIEEIVRGKLLLENFRRTTRDIIEQRVRFF